jgi:hypothetical protein
MPANNWNQPTSDQLYRINDVVSALAAEFGIAGMRCFDTDDEYDDMLNDATLTLAGHLFGTDPD